MGKNQTINVILGMTAAAATALLMSLIARDAIGMPPDMVREDALIAASFVVAALAGCRHAQTVGADI